MKKEFKGIMIILILFFSLLIINNFKEEKIIGHSTFIFIKNIFNKPLAEKISKIDNVNDQDQTYNYISKWGSIGEIEEEFYYPRGIDIDAQGNVYVADSVNNRIQKFNSNGVFIRSWGSWGERMDGSNYHMI